MRQWDKDECKKLATYVGHAAKEDPNKKKLREATEEFSKTLKIKLDILFG